VSICTTSTDRTVTLVYTGDQSVKLKPDAEQKRLDSYRAKQLRIMLANVPAGTMPEQREEFERKAKDAVGAMTLPPMWVPADEADCKASATKVSVRALSWLEYQEAESLEAQAQIMRHLELGVLAVDGSADKAKDMLASPAASLVVPLYQAISELTWGN
jgi:hypothetical protein